MRPEGGTAASPPTDAFARLMSEVQRPRVREGTREGTAASQVSWQPAAGRLTQSKPDAAGKPDAELLFAVADNQALHQCALVTDRIVSQTERQTVYLNKPPSGQNACAGIPALQRGCNAALDRAD